MPSSSLLIIRTACLRTREKNLAGLKPKFPYIYFLWTSWATSRMQQAVQHLVKMLWIRRGVIVGYSWLWI